MKALPAIFAIALVLQLSCSASNPPRTIASKVIHRLADYSRWHKAVVHLEGRTGPELRPPWAFPDSIRTNPRLLRKEMDLESVRGRGFIIHGTAVFVSHNGKEYLITARHVLWDSLLARMSFEEVRSQMKRFPSTTQQLELKRAQDEYENRIFNFILRVPSLEDTLEGRSSLMNLSFGPIQLRAYTFSDAFLDLAVISLDHPKAREFKQELFEFGHQPISDDLIDTSDVELGSEVYTVGFPESPSLLKEKPQMSIAELLWFSPYVSLPMISWGRIGLAKRNLPFFWCDMSAYPGNSGGPVIQDGRIVGIISKQAYDRTSGARVPYCLAIKGKYVRKLLDIQIAKDAGSPIN